MRLSIESFAEYLSTIPTKPWQVTVTVAIGDSTMIIVGRGDTELAAGRDAEDGLAEGVKVLVAHTAERNAVTQ